MTADDIREATLVPVKRFGRDVGYDLNSVDVLLEQAAVAIEERDASIKDLTERLSQAQAELGVSKNSLNDYDTALGRVKERVTELEGQLRDAERRLADRSDAERDPVDQPVTLESDATGFLALDEPEFDEPETPYEPETPQDVDAGEMRRFLASKETIANAIIDAQLAADDILSRAETQAESILEQAEKQGNAIIDEYKAERDKINEEIAHLTETKDSLRSDYRSMLRRYATTLDYDIDSPSPETGDASQDRIDQVNAGIDAHAEQIVGNLRNTR